MAANKVDIGNKITEKTGLDGRSIVDAMVDVPGQALAEGQRIELRAFGTFHVVRWGPRHARNPKTGECWWTQSLWRPKFKCSQKILNKINKGEE